MESEPAKQNRPSDIPSAQPQGLAPESAPQPALQSVLSKLWEAVRHGADVIVTLRQENAILQSQLISLKQGEAALQSRIDDFLQRIDTLENTIEATAGPGEIDRLEDTVVSAKITELEDALGQALIERDDAQQRLAQAEAALQETSVQLEEHRDISQLVLQLRTELEARTQLMQELQDGYVDSDHIKSADPTYTIMLEDERDRLTEELHNALAIIDRYRSAGVQHLESPDTADQLALFMNEAAQVRSVPSQNLAEVANRLEEIAQQLDELAGLS